MYSYNKIIIHLLQLLALTDLLFIIKSPQFYFSCLLLSLNMADIMHINVWHLYIRTLSISVLRIVLFKEEIPTHTCCNNNNILASTIYTG